MSPKPESSNEPRLVIVSRRAFLGRSAFAGALIALPGLAACGANDADVFADSSSAAGSSTEPQAAPTTAAGESTVAPTTTDEAVPTTSGAEGAVFPTAAELAVAFTYEVGDSGGRILNPYIAVWIEDPDGNLVDTISLWYLQSQKGLRWIDDLRRWYSVSDQGADTSMSGATRVAGAYTVVWDGTDLDGQPVAQGDYVLYIEAAREHGPYSIASSPITIGDTAFSATLADNSEIVAASAELIL